MTVDRAIKKFYEYYEKAQKMDYLRNPLAWALYKTWIYVDTDGATK